MAGPYPAACSRLSAPAAPPLRPLGYLGYQRLLPEMYGQLTAAINLSARAPQAAVLALHEEGRGPGQVNVLLQDLLLQ